MPWNLAPVYLTPTGVVGVLNMLIILSDYASNNGKDHNDHT